ncbi:MAG TPA: hypothetical protein PKK23_07355 [Nitrospirales bacterium]|nr:hypothetical protein [Nitrospiraceae bacterium]HNP28845.1 hypothetical protein [Nitrospirales bacterium]
MLHRLSLRVLPQLNALVTDPPVRKRKRLVMLAPGLVAFGIYHLLKPVLPLSDPLVLLVFTGCICMLTAIWSYRQGRGVPLMESWREDGAQRWVWLVGWIGLIYGIQLSLLVLAILQVFVAYDFLLHPEGPAMMATIISCTSVTRDAFEIGHVQRSRHQGVLVPTFPDGEALREWIPQKISVIVKWGALVTMMAAAGSWLLFRIGPIELQPIIQSLLVPVIIASIGMQSFFSGQSLYAQNTQGGKPRTWLSSLWFWMWPNLTFSATYFLVLMGMTAFVFRVEQVPQAGFIGMAAGTAMLMALYTLFLGWRKAYEEQLVGIPESIQRCPFVMGMLQNSKNPEPLTSLADAKVGHGNLVN